MKVSTMDFKPPCQMHIRNVLGTCSSESFAGVALALSFLSGIPGLELHLSELSMWQGHGIPGTSAHSNGHPLIM